MLADVVKGGAPSGPSSLKVREKGTVALVQDLISCCLCLEADDGEFQWLDLESVYGRKSLISKD